MNLMKLRNASTEQKLKRNLMELEKKLLQGRI
jgi:hypothetical protein